MATSKYSDLVLSLITLSGGKDDVIVVHKSFVKFTGSLESGMLLGQMLYWTPRAVARGNWIAKTDREFQEELSLSRYALRQARATLEEMGILETENHRFNGLRTVHYRLDLDRLQELWSVWIQTPGRSISDVRSSENARPLTETTTETTTSSAGEKQSDGAGVPVLNDDAVFSSKKEEAERAPAPSSTGIAPEKGPGVPASPVPSAEEQQASFECLMTIPGMDPVEARKAAARNSPARVRGWSAVAGEFRNRAGFIISRLTSGEEPPLVGSPHPAPPDHGAVVKTWQDKWGGICTEFEDGHVSTLFI